MMSPDEALDLVRGLRAHPEHPFRCGVAVVEGQKALRQFHRTGGRLDALVGMDLDAAHPATVPMTEADLTTLLGFRPHSPSIGLVRIPEPVDPCDVVFPAIALEAVSDAANVGAIVRSAAAFGVRTIVTDAATSSPYLRRAVRTSMGTCFRVAHATVDDLAAWFRDLAAEGRRTLVLEQRPLSIPLSEVQGGVEVLAVGNEGAGCSERLLRAAGTVAHIPMADDGLSLNVAAAAAVGMAAVWRV
jgi:tRNA G18 (ribose-2'-O)-methylase SpoU